MTITITTPKGATVTVADDMRVTVNGADRGICTVKRYNPSYAEIIIPGVGAAPVSDPKEVDILKGMVAAAMRNAAPPKFAPHDKLPGESVSEWTARQMYNRNGKLYG